MRRLRIDVDLGKIETNLDHGAQLVDEVLAAITGQRANLNSGWTGSYLLDAGGNIVGSWMIDEVPDEPPVERPAQESPPTCVTFSLPPTVHDVGAAFSAGIVEGLRRQSA